MDNNTYVSFNTWADLLEYVKNDVAPLWYQAPLDYRPARVRAEVLKNGTTVRVFPSSKEADPFIADIHHVARFRRLLSDDPQQPLGRAFAIAQALEQAIDLGYISTFTADLSQDPTLRDRIVRKGNE